MQLGLMSWVLVPWEHLNTRSLNDCVAICLSFFELISWNIVNVFVHEGLLCCLSDGGRRNHWRIYNLNLHMMFNLSVRRAYVCVCICVAHKQLQTQMVFTYLYDFTRIFFAVIVFTFCVLTHLNIVCTFHFPSQHFYRMNLLAIRLFSLFRVCFSLYFRSLPLSLHFQQLIHSHSFDEKGISDLHNAFHKHTHTHIMRLRKKHQTNCFNAWYVCVCLSANVTGIVFVRMVLVRFCFVFFWAAVN